MCEIVLWSIQIMQGGEVAASKANVQEAKMISSAGTSDTVRNLSSGTSLLS